MASGLPQKVAATKQPAIQGDASVSLLRDIQNSAVDTNTDISTLLRKCKILSTRLGNCDFKEWVDCELNGYTSKENLPAYRILSTQSYGNFSGLFGKQLKNAPIPSLSIPEEFRNFATTSYLLSPIMTYIDLLSHKNGNPTEQWPADYIAYFGQNIYTDMTCISAWKLIPRNVLAALIDTIKTRVLSFVLEIEAEAPDAGEAKPNSNPIPQEKIAKVFNTYITGNVQNVATGSSHVNQSRDISIFHNDFESLHRYLSSQGLTHDDLNHLRMAIHDDTDGNGKQNYGTCVQQWFAKMLGKAASGTWDVSTSVASTVIGNALSNYFGI